MAYNPLRDPVDFVLVNGLLTPGVSAVRGASTPRKWDERVGYGWSGSFPVFLGNRLTKFKIFSRLTTDADWEVWENFRPLVMRPPFGKRPAALAVWHPWLVMCDVKAMVVEDCSQPEEDDDTGAYAITIDCMAWRAPKITLVKPEAAPPAAPTDPADQFIERLIQQVERLANG